MLSQSPVSASPASSKPPLPDKDAVPYSPSQSMAPIPRSYSPNVKPPSFTDLPNRSNIFLNDTDSLLTSPHSNAGDSVLTSPHSVQHTPPQSINLVLPVTPPTPYRIEPSGLRNDQASSDGHGLSNEAGALYYMQNDEPPSPPQPQPTPSQFRKPTYSQAPSTKSQDTVSTSPRVSNMSPSMRQSTLGSSSVSSSVQGERLGSRPGLGRKPSGARGPPSSHASEAPLLSSRRTTTTTTTDSDSQVSDLQMRADEAYILSPGVKEDDNDDLDALAALSYLDEEDPQPPPTTPPLAIVEPLRPRSREPSLSPPPTTQREPFKSSFAPSKHAAERKAKAEAEKAAQQAAAARPGRASNAKRSMRAATTDNSKGWDNESSEEEDDEEDEDEDGSDDEKSKTTASSRAGMGQQQQPGNGYSSENGAPPSHLRPPRNLPMPPMTQNGSQMSVPRPPGNSSAFFLDSIAYTLN